MLQQIPDDPGGLLRRKFLYQSRQRGGQQEADQSW
jgi:Ca-activated chloride channel family protein